MIVAYGKLARGLRDPYWNNTVLLVHADGTNGSTTITDSTGKNTLAVSGSTHINTAQSKFGGSSIYFNGSGSNLNTTNNSNLALGSGDFTIECFARLGGTQTQDATLVYNGTWAANKWALHVTHSASGNKLAFWCYNINSGAASLTSSGSILDTTWHHLVLCRQSNVIRMFVDGVLQSSITTSASIDGGSSEQLVFGGVASSNWLDGYIDELRITKGVARYTSNFTPPTTPFLNS